MVHINTSTNFNNRFAGHSDKHLERNTEIQDENGTVYRVDACSNAKSPVSGLYLVVLERIGDDKNGAN